MLLCHHAFGIDWAMARVANVAATKSKPFLLDVHQGKLKGMLKKLRNRNPITDLELCLPPVHTTAVYQAQFYKSCRAGTRWAKRTSEPSVAAPSRRWAQRTETPYSPDEVTVYGKAKGER